MLVCVCVCARTRAHMCLGVHVVCCRCVDRTCLYDSNLVTRDSDSCLHSADTPGNSKIDIREDLEIRTGSCSADQMAIRARNCVISCECLFICLFSLFNLFDYLYISCERLYFSC